METASNTTAAPATAKAQDKRVFKAVAGVGIWGRGKTFTAADVERELKRRQDAGRTLPDWNIQRWLDAKAIEVVPGK